MPTLTNPKHELFAQELAKGKSQIEAYEAAGYRPNRSAASRLAEDVNICERVASFQERAAAKVETTVEGIARQLDEDRALAHQLGQPGAAVSASMGKAKVLGLIVDKTIAATQPLEDLLDSIDGPTREPAATAH